MTDPTVHGHTKSGKPITDELITALAAKPKPATTSTRSARRAPSAAGPRSVPRRPAWSPCAWTPSYATSSPSARHERGCPVARRT